MLYDFMKQIISRLDGIEKKVDANQQNLERIVRKIEKRKVSTTVLLCCLHVSDHSIHSHLQVKRWSHEQPTYIIMLFLRDGNCLTLRMIRSDMKCVKIVTLKMSKLWNEEKTQALDGNQTHDHNLLNARQAPYPPSYIVKVARIELFLPLSNKLFQGTSTT